MLNERSIEQGRLKNPSEEDQGQHRAVEPMMMMMMMMKFMLILIYLQRVRVTVFVLTNVSGVGIFYVPHSFQHSVFGLMYQIDVIYHSGLPS
jgi:hypothetical protein